MEVYFLVIIELVSFIVVQDEPAEQKWEPWVVNRNFGDQNNNT